MIEIVPIQDIRYKTSDGTHWGTEKEAILHEIECAIGENPAYLIEDDDWGGKYWDISSKEDMLHFIQHNPDLVKYILRIKKDKYISKITYREYTAGFSYTEYFRNTGQNYDEAMIDAKLISKQLEINCNYIIVNTEISEIKCLK